MTQETLPTNNEKKEKPVAEFEGGKYQLFNIEELPEEERLAALDAIAAYQKSDNKEFRAGAVAVAENGDKAVRHNEFEGQSGHAEMLALAALSRTVAPGEFKLKLLALAGTYPTSETPEETPLYGEDVKLRDIDVHYVCGHCLKFISDYSRGNAIDEKGVEDLAKDVTLLMVATNWKQVLRTTLRTMHPHPHRVSQVPLKPLQQGANPAAYNGNGGNGKH
ncbi:MAG: hypothetical protein Q7R93_00580 [bacterium]|nr:hypothetical protein [bacterium]